jgi:iron complex transport system substrate-binding protein
MKKYNKKQFNKVNPAAKEKGEMSRRHFLLGAGSVVIGGALGGGLLSGCKEEVTTTKVVSSTMTVSVPTTVEVPVTSTVTETSLSTVTETSTVTQTSTVTETAAEAKTITVTDSLGREVTLNLPVNRVSYLHPTIAEGLRIIDAWDRVISVDITTTNEVFFPNLAELPVLSYTESGAIDYESIIALEPDILFVLATPGSFDMDALVAAMEPEIPVVFVFDTYDVNTWSSGIELLGKIMQKEDEAQEFIGFCQQIEESVTSKTTGLAADEMPSYFLKVPGWTTDQFCTFTDEFAFVKKLGETTGAVNIAADLPSTGGWVENVDVEWLMTREYEHILVNVWVSITAGLIGYNVLDTAALEAYREELMQLDAFSLSQAVADENVYITDTFFMTTPRYFILMLYAAKMFHPELFEDLDPEAAHQEYLTRFMRIDFNLDESGVFFYPEV